MTSHVAKTDVETRTGATKILVEAKPAKLNIRGKEKSTKI